MASFTRSVLLLTAVLARVSADNCALRIAGFTGDAAKFNGNWINSGFKSSGNTDYMDYTLDGSYDYSLQYAGPGTQGFDSGVKAWVIFSGGIGDSKTLAKCESAACVAATDLGSLGASEWEVAQADGKVGASISSTGSVSVSVSCCPHKTNTCHTCNDDDCKKHTTYAGCIAASAVGCCTAKGMINGNGCLCTDKLLHCLPVDAVHGFLASNSSNVVV